MPDMSVALFGMDPPLCDDNGWKGPATAEVYVEAKELIVGQKTKCTELVRALVLEKYGYPDGGEEALSDDVCSRGPVHALLAQVYETFFLRLREAIARWKDTKAYSEAKILRLKVKLMDFYRRQIRKKAALGREVAIIFASIWLLELAETEFMGPAKWRDQLEDTAAELDEREERLLQKTRADASAKHAEKNIREAAEKAAKAEVARQLKGRGNGTPDTPNPGGRGKGGKGGKGGKCSRCGGSHGGTAATC